MMVNNRWTWGNTCNWGNTSKTLCRDIQLFWLLGYEFIKIQQIKKWRLDFLVRVGEQLDRLWPFDQQQGNPTEPSRNRMPSITSQVELSGKRLGLVSAWRVPASRLATGSVDLVVMSACWWFKNANKPVIKHYYLGGHLWSDHDDDDEYESPHSSGINMVCRADGVFHYQWWLKFHGRAAKAKEFLPHLTWWFWRPCPLPHMSSPLWHAN